MKQSKTDNKKQQASPSGKDDGILEPRPRNAETPYHLWGILALLLLWAVMILWTLKGH